MQENVNFYIQMRPREIHYLQMGRFVLLFFVTRQFTAMWKVDRDALISTGFIFKADNKFRLKICTNILAIEFVNKLKLFKRFPDRFFVRDYHFKNSVQFGLKKSAKNCKG